MLQNERQYEVTKGKLAWMRQCLEEAEANPRTDISPRAHRAGLNGMRALIGDMEAELAEYEKLRAGKVPSLELSSLDDVPATLVRARIARGWTHKDLAQALGTTEQQVQKDEAGGYQKANLQKLSRVAGALELSIRGRAKIHYPKKSRKRPATTRRKPIAA